MGTANPITTLSAEKTRIASLSMSVDQLVAAATTTDINFNTIIRDPDGLFNANVGALGVGGFIVPAGITLARFTVLMFFDANATGTYRQAAVKKNGTMALGAARGMGFIANAVTSFDTFGVGLWQAVVANDYFSARAFHDAGISLNVRSGTGAAGSWFQVEMR